MLTRATIFWLLAYLAAMTLVVAGLMVVRQRTLARLDTPDARRQWQQWKQQTNRQQQANGPVRRRPVSSDEAPALILLRDRFGVIVATTVMVFSFLFAFLVFVARGTVGSGGRLQ